MRDGGMGNHILNKSADSPHPITRGRESGKRRRKIMKYFFDTEFIEGFHNVRLWGIKIPKWLIKPRWSIQLISIGIVCYDGREYYAVSNEFNPKGADEWVRQNVLDKLQLDLYRKEGVYAKTYHHESLTLRNLLKWHGKSNKKIANEIYLFCLEGEKSQPMGIGNPYQPVAEFYGYYADYDWVLFCSLFGRMIDLPKGFPMYCRDLKQMMDDANLGKEWKEKHCPEPANAHLAIEDARWNMGLFKALEMEMQTKKQQP